MNITSEDEMLGKVCSWCGEAATFVCGFCGEARFCSREHQRLSWEDHYRECRAYKIQSTPEAGQFLVASRNIKPGTILLEDVPIAVAPLGTSDIICLSCYAPIFEKNFFRCPDCFWPMCCMECANAEVHDKECDILSRDTSHCGTPEKQGETPRYDLILVLRCLLLKKFKPEMWNVLYSMANHSRELQDEKEPYQQAAVRYLTEICQVDLDLETVHHVRGVILANALEIRGPKGDMLRAMYPTIRLFNHSCIPNVHLSTNNDGVMVAKAAVEISKGEALCITYTGTDVPIWERQACLSSAHYFNCLCRRCTDPTELGTMFSSSRCLYCPEEIMQHAIHADGKIVWSCPKCGSESTTEEMKQEIEEWLFRLEMNELFGSCTPYRISHALAIIEQHFHISHYIWLKASQAALGKMAHNTSFQAMKLKKYIWENILQIYDKLEPGLTRRRGMTLLELATATLNLANQEFLAKGELSLYQVEHYLKEAKNWYYKGCQILTQEPSGTPENSLAGVIPPKITMISEDLKDLAKIMRKNSLEQNLAANDLMLRIWE